MKNTKRIIIFDFNRTLYDPNTDSLVSGALQVLQRFSLAFSLYLLSTDSPSRLFCIKDLGIERYFKKIVLVPEKSIPVFEFLARFADIPSSYVVGDRVRSEIRMGKTVGFQTIWVQSGKFSEETPRTATEQPDHTVSSLLEILSLIR
ncbi:MAG: HAD hydrolase-like protein [bacterium]|nr:HAD hydrolase-like protein [bacterium]